MKENFSRATILGCACVITSDFTPEELENFTRFLPEALVLTDVYGGDLFKIELAEGGEPGSIEQERVSYSREKVPGGRATVTLVLDPSAEDKEALIRNKLGLALIHLDALEKQIRESKEALQENMRKARALVRSENNRRAQDEA